MPEPERALPSFGQMANIGSCHREWSRTPGDFGRINDINKCYEEQSVPGRPEPPREGLATGTASYLAVVLIVTPAHSRPTLHSRYDDPKRLEYQSSVCSAHFSESRIGKCDFPHTVIMAIFDAMRRNMGQSVRSTAPCVCDCRRFGRPGRPVPATRPRAAARR